MSNPYDTPLRRIPNLSAPGRRQIDLTKLEGEILHHRLSDCDAIAKRVLDAIQDAQHTGSAYPYDLQLLGPWISTRVVEVFSKFQNAYEQLHGGTLFSAWDIDSQIVRYMMINAVEESTYFADAEESLGRRKYVKHLAAAESLAEKISRSVGRDVVPGWRS